ncbi:MAG TPA: ricin-type beta-trefoil lectin domain protein [Streptosporangiaceae bacterium]|nr:ricin-type beta-trefoil lectin domain protein [Streptosporangiaceae bacterium]
MMRLRRAAWGLGAAAAVAGLAVTGVVVLPSAAADSPPAVTARRDGPAAAGAAVAAMAGAASRMAAAAGLAAASQASPASTHSAHRSNVGNTHSPRLLRQLAGPAGTRGPVISGPRAAATAGPVDGAAQGVDVASFQHPNGAAIDWQQVAAAGIKFAAVKVTEGAYYTNPFAASDLTEAKAAGLTPIGYAFAIPNGGSDGSTQFSPDPKVQADDLIGALPSPMPVMLDIEYDPYAGPPPHGDGTTGVCYGLSEASMVSWIAAFNAEVQAKTGWLPVIYTTQDWWSTCTGGSTAFGSAPIWPADYSNSSPSLPAGWGNWNLWQYTSTGTVSGIQTSGHTDLDQANPAMITLLDTGLNQAVPSKSTVAGSTVGRQFVASDSSGQTPAFTGAGLPPGLSVSSNGLVSGWPDKPGTYHPVVTAADSAGGAGSASFTWTVTAAPNSGPTGPVRLNLGGKCLDDSGNKTADGTKVVIWTCNGSAAQRWTVVKDDTLRIHGKCLRVRSAASGTLADLFTCNGSTGQRWQLQTGGQLVNPRSGLCLSDPGSSTTNGKQLKILSCQGSASQEWLLPAGPIVSGIPGKCLDDSGNATADGTKIVISACNNTTEQKWVAQPGGTVRIHGKCLDAGGAAATLHTCDGSAGQQWRINPNGPGTMLENPGSGCLADPDDSTADGTQAVILSCSTADPGMAWRVH